MSLLRVLHGNADEKDHRAKMVQSPVVVVLLVLSLPSAIFYVES
jgi:hypothetical protein